MLSSTFRRTRGRCVSTRPHDLVLSDPFRYEEFEVPSGSLEEAFLEKSRDVTLENKGSDIFLSRLIPKETFTGNIDLLVSSGSTRPTSVAGNHAIDLSLVEVETYPNVEELERTQEFLSIEEMLAEDWKLEEEERAKDLSAQRKVPEKLHVDKWGFVIEGDEEEGPEETVPESKKQKEKETHRAEKWLNIHAQWESYSEEKKKKLKQRFRKGIPDRLRGAMWKKLLECDEFRQQNKNLFQDLLRRDSPFEVQINKDINRTFPKHIFFREAGGMGQKALYNTLKAYSIYDPMVGYCQGMGFIVALLLLYMPAEDAFFIMVKLCTTEKFNMAGIYSQGFPLLHVNLFILEQLIEIYLPRLAAHFKNQMITCSMFATDWFTTGFAYSLPFPFVIRIFDVFLSEGSRSLFNIALGFLKLQQSELLGLGFEEIFFTLKHISKLSFSPDDLLKTALEFNISSRRLNKLASECEEKKPSASSSADKHSN